MPVRSGFDAHPNRYRSVSDYRDLASTYDASCRRIGYIRSAAVNALVLQPGQTVFDVACGTGATLLELACRVGPRGRVIGIDHSPEMAAIARQRIAASGVRNIELVVEVMRTHPEIGHRILSSATFMTDAAKIVLYHEERYDGSGYPIGLIGNEIPLWARLFAVIDTLDAMTSGRPYRKALSFEVARAEILRQSGTQFDPIVTEVFEAEVQTLRAMVEMKCSVAEHG